MNIRINIWHPLLFAIYPVLTLYSSNMDETPFASFLFPFLVILGTSFVLWILINYFIKDLTKSSLILTSILILFFLYGHFHTVLFNYLSSQFLYKANFKLINSFAKTDVVLHVIMLVLFFLLIGLLVFFIKNKQTISPYITRFFNIMSLILVFFALSRMVLYGMKTIRYVSHDKLKKTGEDHGLIKRDIYYIILDGYARKDVLKRYYGFDNSEFLNYLKQKNFYIVTNSYANYGWTFLSLASSLNYKYLNYLTDIAGKESGDVRILYKLIKKNRVAQFLKSQGYQFIHFNSTWGATLHNKYADKEIVYKKGVFNDEFFRMLVCTTMLKVLDSFIVEDLADIHLYTFAKLEEIPEITEPTFTFAHMVLPHHPYIFDRYGNVKNHASLFDQFQSRKWSLKDDYLEQLQFVNKKIKEVINALIEKSDIPPLIIIQSDHGPQVFNIKRRHYIKARMSNLNALFLPDHGDKWLYNSLTPVNTFRVIFNYYFKTRYNILEDRIYFSKMEKPYHFKEMKYLKKTIRRPLN